MKQLCLFIDTDPTTPTQFTLTLESDNGNYICVRAEDEAGNITKKASVNTISGIDTTDHLSLQPLTQKLLFHPNQRQFTLTKSRSLSVNCATVFQD